MKLILPLFLLVVSCIGCYESKSSGKGQESEEVQINDTRILFVEPTSFDTILTQSAQQDKPIFVDFYAPWCPPCREMDQKVFTNSQAAVFYNKNFINVKLNVKQELGRSLARKYGIRDYPTLVYLDANGESLLSSIGYIDAPMLIEFGMDVLKDYRK